MRSVPCEKCPFRTNDAFRKLSKEESKFVEQFKRGELTAEAGSTFLNEGVNSPHLYTVISGWGFRFKTLADGRRQILNFVMPGDFVGLQSSLLDHMEHSVESLSDMVLCVFEKERVFDIFKRYPSLSFDITWIAAREEQMLDEHLLSVGRRNALERMAYLLAFLCERAKTVDLFEKRNFIERLTQQHVADTLGLSLVHTNKTLRKLHEKKAAIWRDNGCLIQDLDLLKSVAGWDGLEQTPRPFI